MAHPHSPAKRIEALTDTIIGFLSAIPDFKADTRAAENAVLQILGLIGDAYREGKAAGESPVRDHHHPDRLDDHEDFLRTKGLEEEFKAWLSTQPVRW